MYLNASTDSIEIILGGTVTANQLQWNVSFQDITSSGMTLPQSGGAGLTNNATLVTMVSAPAASTTRQVTNINVYNADTATAMVTIRKDVSGTNYVLIRYALTTLDTLMWSREDGWRVMAGSGAITALTGDVTASGTGSVVATIANDAVTFAKMQNIATDRLLGRDTAGSGDVEELSVGGGIEFTGTGIQTSAFTGDVTKSAGGTATTIANQAVTYAKMQNVSAASRLLGRGSAAGAGSPEEITLGTNLSMSGTTLNATGGGVSTVGTINSQTKSADGAVISGSSLVMQTADGTNPGLVSTGTQTFAGNKTLTGESSTTGNALVVNNLGGTAKLTVANAGRVSLTSDTTATTQTVSVITTDTTNAGLVLRPNGTGAIMAQVPDGTTTGGNARGSGSVDFGLFRNAATAVASGARSFVGTGDTLTASATYSVAVGGRANVSSGQASFIGAGESNSATTSSSVCVGGSSNVSSGKFSVITGGYSAYTGLYAQRANASGQFAAPSDAQTSSLTYRISITGIAQTELLLDGGTDGTSRAILLLTSPGPTNARAWRAQVDVVAIASTVGNGTITLNDCFMGSYHVGIKRIGTTTSLVGSVSVTNEVSDTSMSTSVVTIDADDTNEALRIRFTPPSTAGSTTVIRVVATAYITEVGR